MSTSDRRPSRRPLGGVIHSYQRYDPQHFPPPTQPPTGDAADAAMEHMLMYGSMREFTDEQLRNAVRLDPSQIAGLGPSLDALVAMLEERKRKILERYDPSPAVREGAQRFAEQSQDVRPPKEYREEFHRAVRDQQLAELEGLWYRAERKDREFAGDVLNLMASLGELYEAEELKANYAFTGREGLDLESALAVKQELATIDKLLEQLREAIKTAQLALIDMDELRNFVDEARVDELREFGERIESYMRERAELEGLERDAVGNYQLTPKAYRTFQGKLLDELFSELEAGRSGRHRGPVVGEGMVELPRTKAYEFGDSVAHLDVGQSVLNAAARRFGAGAGANDRLRLDTADLEIHRTRNTPKCATCIVMDMSGSMRQMGQYISCKRMALAMEALIRTEYPGDFMRFIEMYSLARLVPAAEIVRLMPKPVFMRDPVVRLRVNLSDPELAEGMLPPHFTNIQRALSMSRQVLAGQDTPNKQIFLITDGLPTAHIEAGTGKDAGKQFLYLLYPPDPLTEQATMREAIACKREGITINIFLMPSWSQTEEDIAFAHRIGEQSGGRVVFTGGRDLDRFVLWDYVSNRRRIIG